MSAFPNRKPGMQHGSFLNKSNANRNKVFAYENKMGSPFDRSSDYQMNRPGHLMQSYSSPINMASNHYKAQVKGSVM
jgi:hypothetical protein